MHASTTSSERSWTTARARLGPDRSIGILPEWSVSGSCGLEPCETNEEPTREGRDRPVNPTVAVRKEAPW